MLIAAASAVVLILGSITGKFAKYRIYAIFLILSLAIGPGLLVNLTLKNYWGRPRPVEVKQFGGMWDYQPVLQKGVGGRGKSFSSGHASAGYYFFVFYFIFRRKKRAAAFLALTMAIVYGTLLGILRMSMGGHFLSDVLWSAFIVFFSSLALYHFILRIPQWEDAVFEQQATPSPKNAPAILTYCVITAGIIFTIALTTPVFKDIHHEVDMPYVRPYNITIRCTKCNVNISLADSGVFTVSGTAQGAGMPGNDIEETFTLTKQLPLSEYKYELTPHGFYSTLTSNLAITVGTNNVSALSVDVEQGNITVQRPEVNTKLPQRIFIRLNNGKLSLPEILRDKPIDLSGTKAEVSYK